jgi:hypothetical protein
VPRWDSDHHGGEDDDDDAAESSVAQPELVSLITTPPSPLEPNGTRYVGKIQRWNRGFGFIDGTDFASPNIYLHESEVLFDADLDLRNAAEMRGVAVSFRVEPSERRYGQYQAYDAVFLRHATAVGLSPIFRDRLVQIESVFFEDVPPDPWMYDPNVGIQVQGEYSIPPLQLNSEITFQLQRRQDGTVVGNALVVLEPRWSDPGDDDDDDDDDSGWDVIF